MFENFDQKDREILLAALAAMVLDVHAPQDQLTDEQWQRAGELYVELDPEGAPNLTNQADRGARMMGRNKSIPPTLEGIRDALIAHLGSEEAADAWLDSPNTGYPTTARAAIEAGRADFVAADLENQWGPGPNYS